MKTLKDNSVNEIIIKNSKFINYLIKIDSPDIKKYLDDIKYLHPKATRNDYISSDEKISEGGTKSNISRLQELGLLKRKGGKKNGEWIVAIDIDFSNDVE